MSRPITFTRVDDATGETVRRCSGCKEYKPFTPEFFHRNTKSRTGFQGRCKRCCNSSKDAGYHRAHHWKFYFKMSVAQTLAMYHFQDGKCLICRIPEVIRSGGMVVDHCHSTGKVRGFLCCTCNRMLGQARDSKLILQNAISYLESRR